MIVRRLNNVLNLTRAAHDVGVQMFYPPERLDTKGHAFRFRLKPRSDGKRHPWKRFPYWRTSTGYMTRGRMVCAVCWHGHRDFFRRLFILEPDCRVYTALLHQVPGLKFWSAENFEDNFESTGNINCGPPIAPVTVSEVCRCEETAIATIPQSALTSECWPVQMQGLKACDTCVAADTDECGGPLVRKYGMNELGYTVPVRVGSVALLGTRAQVTGKPEETK